MGDSCAWWRSRYISFGVLAVACAAAFMTAARADASSDWFELFDGQTLDGWRASEHAGTWRVENDALVARGPRSHLFYAGPVGNHDFRNFELLAEVRTEQNCNSGIFFHTQYQQSGWPKQGYEIQLNNTYLGRGNYRELKRTGSLYAVRNIYPAAARDEEWFSVRVSVKGNRVRVWVNGNPTVDYLQPEDTPRKPKRAGRVLTRGTFALQGHDAGSVVAFRRVAVRLLPDDADPAAEPRASDDGYGVAPSLMDRLAGASIPLIDYHIHLRGGMTVEKAMDRQAVTGIGSGVLKNIGQGWPIETNEQLRQFLDTVEGRPVFVGLQVNDRDWMDKHAAELLERLDFVLGDTMIMPMPRDNSPPVKLWQPEHYTIVDPQAWMDRYVQHNLRVLAEPITILANPTYLPPPVKDKYDELWTDERMRTIIQAAIDNSVALEINGSSGLPSDGFIGMAQKMGAKFSFGSNNFNDKPINMSRCLEAIERFGLTKDDIYVPGR